MLRVDRRSVLRGALRIIGCWRSRPLVAALLAAPAPTAAAAPSVASESQSATARSSSADGAWYWRASVYGLLPLPPGEAQALGLTLNGLWGGYLWDSPIRQGDYLYPSDSEHITAMHAAGLRSAGVIDATGAFEPMVAHYPVLQETVELRADGQPAIYQTEARYYLMNPLSPAWLNWQIEEGRRIIDAGADLITLDNVVPVGRAIQLGWQNQPGGTPGLSNGMIAGFRAYLEQVDPALATMNGGQLRRRLRLAEPYLYGSIDARDPLLDHWVAFWKATSYEHMRTLIEALRTYALERGRVVPIAGNWSLLDSRLGAAGEYAIDPADYWSLIDLFAAECSYSTASEDDSLMPMPRQKLLGYYRLAWGIKPVPSVFLPSVSSRLITERWFVNRPNFYLIQMAEAYANRQSLVVYSYPGDQAVLNFCRALTPLTAFITANAALYESTRAVYAEVALVLLSADSGAAYHGLAQALAESQLQHETIVALDDDLTVTQLTPYPTVVVVTLAEARPQTARALNDYVSGGGRLIVMGANGDAGLIEHPGLVQVGADLGSLYLQDYAEPLRHEIRRLLLGERLPHVTLNHDRRTVVATAYTGEGLLVIHLVNYDHNFEDDSIVDALDLQLTVQHPGGRRHQLAAVFSPDEGTAVASEVAVSATAITIRLPRLHRYTVVLLQPTPPA